MTARPFPPSLIEQATYIVRELGVEPDQPTPHEYGKLVSNLAMLRMNAFLHAFPDPVQTWEEFINHLMYPDFKPLPEGLFKVESDHYKLALQAIDEIFNKYAPE